MIQSFSLQMWGTLEVVQLESKKLPRPKPRCLCQLSFLISLLFTHFPSFPLGYLAHQVLCSLWFSPLDVSETFSCKGLVYIPTNSVRGFPFLHTLPSPAFTVCRLWQWHPTPVLLPGKSHGQRSLVGCSPWGRTESAHTHTHIHTTCEFLLRISSICHYPLVLSISVPT